MEEFKKLELNPLHIDPATVVKMDKRELQAAHASHRGDCLVKGTQDRLDIVHEKLKYGELRPFPEHHLGMNISSNVNANITVNLSKPKTLDAR